MTAFQLALLVTRVTGGYLLLQSVLGFVADLGVISIWWGSKIGDAGPARNIQVAASAGTLLQLVIGAAILAKSTAIARFLAAEAPAHGEDTGPGISQVVLLVTRLVALLMIAGGAYVLVAGLILAATSSHAEPLSPALAMSIPTILIGVFFAGASRSIAGWLAGE